MDWKTTMGKLSAQNARKKWGILTTEVTANSALWKQQGEGLNERKRDLG